MTTTTQTKRNWSIENSQGCHLDTFRATTARGAYRIFRKTWSLAAGDYVTISGDVPGTTNNRESVRITAR